MSPNNRNAKKHAKASKRRYLKAQERLARDRRQAQQAAQALEQALVTVQGGGPCWGPRATLHRLGAGPWSAPA